MLNKVISLGKRPFSPQPKANDVLKAMHKDPIPAEMQKFLRTFENGTDISLEHSVAGIKRFTEFANLDFDDRQRLFGNGYLGLHYNNDLSKKWNEMHSDSVKAYS